MSKTLFVSILAIGLTMALPARADRDHDDDGDALTLAVYGDAPYGCKAPTSANAPDECPAGYFADDTIRADPARNGGPIPGDTRQLDATPNFIKAVNADRKVSLVLHVGDIHSGATFCTLAYDQRVFDLWTQFRDPLIYTPGDNEWTDCQKSKEGGGAKYIAGPHAGEYVDYAAGHPVANLALVRALFFAEPGETLGGGHKQVTSQAQAFDPDHPTDAEYVENVRWEQSRVMFVTLNIPGGSNNDDDLWNTGAFGTARSAPQIQEFAQRNGANLRWLDAAFALAKAHGDTAVLIMEQADMWDLDGTLLSAGHILNYKPYINAIAALTADFGKPVLLINGDSHRFRSDNPLQDNASCIIETGDGTSSSTATVACSDDAYDNQFAPSTNLVPNFHRLVVHGSTFPLQYTRLTVNPRANNPTTATSFGPFSWERVIP